MINGVDPDYHRRDLYDSIEAGAYPQWELGVQVFEDTEDQTFDPVAFDNYSPLYLPASFAITYLIAFALSSAMIVHTVLYHGKTVLHGLTQTRLEKDDIHAKLMRAYPEVPDWWYLLTFIACFALAIVTAEVRSVLSVCADIPAAC